MLILNSPVYPDLYLVIFSIMVVIILAILNAGNVFLLLKGVDIYQVQSDTLHSTFFHKLISILEFLVFF